MVHNTNDQIDGSASIMMIGRLKTAGGMMLVAALAACSGNEGPQAPPMLADGTCAQLRADLNGMDKRGVPGMIDARNNGKKYAAQQDAEINRYNQVLDQYLGGQCASEQRYKARGGSAAVGETPAAGRKTASLTTGSISKTQVKRRKPADAGDEASAPVEKISAPGENVAKPARRKSAQSAGAAAAAKASSGDAPAAKSDSGLPSAPPATKPESTDKQD